MHFAGKSKKQFDVSFEDPRLARIVRRCQDLPGQLLFQYVNGDGTARPVHSSDVNEYLREHTALDATAKTFRTWNATVYAAAALAAQPPPDTVRQGRSTVMAMLKVVSAELNNTPAVCRRSYIHPAIIDSYLAGGLSEMWSSASARGSRLLSTEERKTLSLIDVAVA
jgi:DNA topoisomerase-1